MTPTLEDLHRRHRAELVAHARRLLANDADAEDVIQDAFLRAYRALAAPGTDRPRASRAWLYRIVRNAALDELRCARRQHASHEASADALEDRDPLRILTGQAELRAALASVAALPPRQRDALLLHAVDGLDHVAIASRLAITDGASRALVHRARGGLRAA